MRFTLARAPELASETFHLNELESWYYELINNMSQSDSACESFKHVARGTATLLACNSVFYYIQLLPRAVSRCHIHPSSSSKTRIFPLQYHHSMLGYNIPSGTDICSAAGDRWTSDSGNRILSSSVVRYFNGLWQRSCYVGQFPSPHEVLAHFHVSNWRCPSRKLYLAESLQKVRDASVGQSGISSLFGKNSVY